MVTPFVVWLLVSTLIRWNRESDQRSAANIYTAPRNLPFQAPASGTSVEDRPVDLPSLSSLRQLQVNAEQGDKEAQYQLGQAYIYGDGVVKDQKEAVKWFRLAAEQGLADAQSRVGDLYSVGFGGLPESVLEAVKWWAKAAAQGYAGAQHSLGCVYAEGSVEGLPKDMTLAVKLYRQAAEQNFPEAQFSLGICYDNGDGVPKNAMEAMKWYQLAAVQGHAEAQFFLGYGYENGHGLPKDEAEAVKWYRRAADQGYAPAQFFLGSCYTYGHGVAKNEEEAARWFQRAAKQGDADSQRWLGTCYANGDGVMNNPTLGHMWLNLASAQGDEKAKENLLLVEAQMTSSQIAEAEKMAVNFKPTIEDGSQRKTEPITIASSPQDSGISDPLLRHLPSDERLTSGSILTDHLTPLGGKGKLTLDNGLTEDAFVKMLNDDRLVASFYVRGGEKFAFTHVPDGVYKLIYCTGFGWDAARRDFERGRHAMRYDKALDFTTTRRTEGNSIITSTGVMTLTLHKVANGNARTSGIPLEEFDRY